MKAEFKVGDTIVNRLTGKILTITTIKDGYYEFGRNDEGYPMIAEIKYQDQFELYRPSVKRTISRWFRKLRKKNRSKTKWTSEYSVDGDKMVFHHIDTPEKRLTMIKVYESLKKGGK